MKKTAFLVIVIFFAIVLSGCKSSQATEVISTLDQDNLQVQVALGDNFDSKVRLLNSPDLTGEGLVALCANPSPMNIKQFQIRDCLIEAFERTPLTPEQELMVVKLKKFSPTLALLLKSDLSPGGLVAICETPGDLNEDSIDARRWFSAAFERIRLAPDQEIRIAEIGEYTYSMGMLCSSNLTPEGLIAICNNPGELNIKNSQIQRIFISAINRADLSEEQKLEIAASKIGGLGLF